MPVDSGQAQAPRDDDGTRSRSTVQTQPESAEHLPRLRRCSCCLNWWRADGEYIRYRWIRGCTVTLLVLTPRLPERTSRYELERVTVVPLDLPGTFGYRYELIRGGRWVDEWQALFGRHHHEHREVRRR